MSRLTPTDTGAMWHPGMSQTVSQQIDKCRLRGDGSTSGREQCSSVVLTSNQTHTLKLRLAGQGTQDPREDTLLGGTSSLDHKYTQGAAQPLRPGAFIADHSLLIRNSPSTCYKGQGKAHAFLGDVHRDTSRLPEGQGIGGGNVG